MTGADTRPGIMLIFIPYIYLTGSNIMQTSPLNFKSKIAVHSFGISIIFLVLLLISITTKEIPIAPYLLLGLITGETGSIIFSRRKYIASVDLDEATMTIHYFNRMLIKKSVSIEKDGLDILDINEVNWWYGKLNLISFSHGKTYLTFNFIDSKVKEKVFTTLNE
jgi:hypothetical protein